jgi:regulator of extracellular matrix RemA (YlzA/DUF370 family)
MSLGRGGVIDTDRIIAIAQARSAPVKRLVAALQPEQVIYLTYGEPRETVILLENGFLVVTSLPMEALLKHLAGEDHHAKP